MIDGEQFLRWVRVTIREHDRRIRAAGASTGEVTMWAPAGVPAGYLPCDGSEQPVATYPALDAALGTTYGARTNGAGGAGSSHFRVPTLTSVAGVKYVIKT